MIEPKKTNRRSTVFITLLASGIFLLGAGLIPLLINAQQKALGSVAPVLPPATTNYPAPRLELTDLRGNPDSIENYHGQVILVNNWATWCPPCRLEMPELQAYYDAHVAQGFVVIAIESGDPIDQVASFVQEFGLTFPVWLDPKSKSLETFNNWDLPSSYVIDRDGIVRLSWTGGVTRSTLEQFVTPLLEENK
jgi:peroxiredoxin